jgi:hypothetical protein
MTVKFSVRCTVLAALLMKLSSTNLSHFSNIIRAFGAIFYLLEPKREGGLKSEWASFTV